MWQKIKRRISAATKSCGDTLTGWWKGHKKGGQKKF